MYSIGEFSRIGSITTKTLRYYDEIGLLHPAYVDEENHYRYYAEEQVQKILFIAELKRYDLRLEQIKAIIESEDQSLLEYFLKKRIQELDDQLQQNLRLKQSIEKKMQRIQLGGSNMDQTSELVVSVSEFKPVLVMSKKATISMDNIGSVIGNVYEEIFKSGLRPAGTVMTFYYDEEFVHENANLEVCIPVEPSEQAKAHKDAKMIQPGLCAQCTYTGVYSKLGEAYAAVIKWIQENGYHISSAPFDVYMNSPKEVNRPEELITNVYFPVSK